MKGYVVGAGEGVGGADPELKASAASTDGALTLVESRATGGAPPHVHSREDECIYILEGSITVRCGDELFRAGPRSFVFLPRGTSHSWDVEGDEAVVLILAIPGGFEGFLREWHDAEGSARDAVAARHGIRMLQPPGVERRNRSGSDPDHAGRFRDFPFLLFAASTLAFNACMSSST